MFFHWEPHVNDRSDAVMRLEGLHERHTGLTESISGTYLEAASVCFSRHHDSPVHLTIACDGESSVEAVEFPRPTDRVMKAWANRTDTTEDGAYGVSLAAVEVKSQLVAVRRAETLTGADWYVAPIGSDPDDLEKCYRLEISGIDTGNQAVMAARLRQKIEQTRKGVSNLPAIASVVGFREKAVVIQTVGDQR